MLLDIIYHPKPKDHPDIILAASASIQIVNLRVC